MFEMGKEVPLLRFCLILVCATLSCSHLPPTAESQTSFVAFGDAGFGNENQKTLALGVSSFCQKEHCDFVALLGDNFYPSGVKSIFDSKWQSHFEEPFSQIDLSFYAVLGNHDYGGSIQSQIDYTANSTKWKMPQRYYSFIRGPVEFFAIDTQNFDLKQAQWLDEKLKASSSQWKCVYGHHPIFSYGTHGDSTQLKTLLLPILRNRADFYLTGHDHDLQYLVDKGRPHFIVSGATGHPRESKKGPRSVYASHRIGFAHFQFTQNKAVVRFVESTGKEVFEKIVQASCNTTP